MWRELRCGFEGAYSGVGGRAGPGPHQHGKIKFKMKTKLEVVSETLAEKLAAGASSIKPWMMSFGKLRSLRRESAHVDQLVSLEFEQIELEDRE